MNERKKGIIISYINIILHALLGFAYVPILLHYIGKSEYGLYQLIGSMIAYFNIMDFGLTAAVVRFYSKYKALEDHISMENILAIAMRVYAVITVLLLCIGSVCYYYMPIFFVNSMTSNELASAKKLFLLLLFNIVITISAMIFRAVINANEKYFFLKGMETIQLVLQPVIVVIALQQSPSAFTVAVVQTILNICLICMRIYYCFKVLKVKICYRFWDGELFSEFKRLALSVFVVTLIDQIFFKTNQVILGYFSGTSSVAVYSVSTLIYMNYMSISLAISSVYLPHITAIVTNNKDRSKLSDLFINIGRVQYYILALVGSGFIIFGKQFIRMWAGDTFIDSYYITLFIILPFTIDLIQNIGLSIMQAMNKYDFRAKVYFFMGIFNLGLAIPLAKAYGGVGCAFATGLSMFIGNGLIMNWYYAKVIGLDITCFWKVIGKITFTIVIITSIGYICNNMILTQSGKAIFLMEILAYTVIYSLAIYNICMNKEEKAKIRGAFSKVLLSK